MQLFTLQNNTLEPIKKKDFALEKNMQILVEDNLEILFWLTFIETEFSINNLRFDSVAFDYETNSFVIIEYKRGSSYSVIDQGFAYLSTLLNNKADFVLLLQEKSERFLKKNEIDWSQTRVMFLADSFNYHQKNSINFKDLPIELWEIKQFSNNTISINQIRATQQTESIKTLENRIQKVGFIDDFEDDNLDKVPIHQRKQESVKPNLIADVQSEILIRTENDFLIGKPEHVVELYEQIKDILISINPDIDIIAKTIYISFKVNWKNFVEIEINSSGLILWLNWNFDAIPNKYWLVRDCRWKGHHWVWNNQIKIKSIENIWKITDILRESYKLLFN